MKLETMPPVLKKPQKQLKDPLPFAKGKFMTTALFGIVFCWLLWIMYIVNKIWEALDENKRESARIAHATDEALERLHEKVNRKKDDPSWNRYRDHLSP